jgi:DNA gyrase/topoisomerase IV subunit A
MLQVQTFLVPSEQDKANEFLKTHKPVGNINFNKDTIVVFYEDDPAADLLELLESVGNAKFQQEVALFMMKRDIAGLNPAHNKGKFEELDNAIRECQNTIDNQDAKAEYLKKRIEEKRSVK